MQVNNFSPSLSLYYWLYGFTGQIKTRLDVLPYSVARWVAGGWDTLKKVGRPFNTVTVKDSWGRPVLL